MDERYSRLTIFTWMLFDYARTSFSVMIKTVGFALYFREIVAAGTGHGDFYWGLADSISMIIAAALSPVLGAASDYSHKKKRFLLVFAGLCILATACLYWIQRGMILPAMLVFIAANVGFQGGYTFYDAFLPEIAPKHLYGRVSGYGFGMGYLGALSILAIAFPFIKGGFSAGNLENFRTSFLLVAGFFAIFSLPTFLRLRDHSGGYHRKLPYFRLGLRRAVRTFRRLGQYKSLSRFLLAFFLYIDGVNTVIFFAALYARGTLNFTEVQVVVFFIVAQTTAILGSIVFGILADHWGPKRSINITLVIWVGVVLSAFLIQTRTQFYIVGLFAGIAIGSSQSCSRSLMALLTPPEHAAEFFGFYDGIAGNASAIMGPLTFGAISSFTGSQRIAVLSVLIFFVGGLILLQQVKVEWKKRTETA
ncbi:MAG: MFS transporter [Bacteroidetes bacterium]|jgi:UMF1 family MFS transporter|nr:MFS transporter [Bacteroidota bacterium]